MPQKWTWRCTRRTDKTETSQELVEQVLSIRGSASSQGAFFLGHLCTMPIPEHVLSPPEFLAQMRAGSVTLDVRSPGEFEEGHLPGATSMPLFTNDERAEVGTLYKHEGKHAALERGLELVGPKMRRLVQQARALFDAQPDRRPLLVHCWRGGMRSGSVDWLLRTAEIPSMICEGGYKACRQAMREGLGRDRKYVVLGGMTGAAKTEVLRALGRRGEAVVDLEALAKHFGSAFGNLDDHAQPTTEQFSNDLAAALAEVDREHGEGATVWLENESRQIGRVHVPEGFHKRLRDAPVLELERTEDDRLDHLVAMYGEASTATLSDAFDKISDKLGGLNVKHAKEHLASGDLREAARLALLYYDKTYQHGLDKRDWSKAVDGRGLSHDDAAARCASALNEWNPWKTSS